VRRWHRRVKRRICRRLRVRLGKVVPRPNKVGIHELDAPKDCGRKSRLSELGGLKKT
jgi:hypothetical protein